jgi:hypothetical protein
VANDVRSVRWGKGELDLFGAAADAAGLNFNAWVRRACREAAALERAVEREESARAEPAYVALNAAMVREFKPDFRPGRKKR